MLYEVEIYETSGGKSPFAEWIKKLRDRKAVAIIKTRMSRIQLGNFGDCKAIGDGVRELRIDFGPGYRVYYAQIGPRVLLLMCGGDKGSQSRDIAAAKSYLEDYHARSKEEEYAKK